VQEPQETAVETERSSSALWHMVAHSLGRRKNNLEAAVLPADRRRRSIRTGPLRPVASAPMFAHPV